MPLRELLAPTECFQFFHVPGDKSELICLATPVERRLRVRYVVSIGIFLNKLPSIPIAC